VRDRVGGAGFYAVATKNASRIVNIVNTSVALASRYSQVSGVFARFNIDAISWTGCCAKKTSYTFLEALFIPVKDMDTTITRLEVDRLFWIIFSNGFAQHICKRHAETLRERYKRVAKFS